MNAATRKRSSIATLVVMGLLWGLDLLTSASPPQSASADQAGGAAAQPGALPAPTPTPSDLGQILAALSAPASRPGFLDAPPRDLFTAGQEMLDRLRPKSATAKVAEVPVATQPVEPEPPTEPEFPPTHVLRGIVWGPRPMAVIDGEPVARGAEISGYRIVEIGRDYVELQRGPRRARLTLAPPNSRPRN